MKLSDYKLIFIAITIILCIPIFIPNLYNILPEREHEKFISLGILDKDGLTENYYPTLDPVIYTGILNKWQIHLNNNFNEIKQIIIKIKILTQLVDPPNSSTCTPCSGINVYEIRRFIKKDQTLNIPLDWMITELNTKDNTSTITEILINNLTRNVNISLEKKDTIRIIFELWIYEQNDDQFHFYWTDIGEKRCVWAQIQFRITENMLA